MSMPAKKATPPIYELKIVLTGIDPPIWRQIKVPSTLLLCCLHDALQAVMGWNDSHLHQFEKDANYWGDPGSDDSDDLKLIDESRVPVAKVLKAEGDTLVYVYDFGDNWKHEVVLDKILRPKVIRSRSVLTVLDAVHLKMWVALTDTRSFWK
jgi:hypothetical protein